MSNLTLENDYIEILKTEFNKRCRRNSAYSLRAFARDIKMAPSTLSEVMKGIHGLSRPTAANIADRLGYQSEEKEYFCDLVDSVHARSRTKREVAKARLTKHKTDPKVLMLSKDTFDFIAEWYHLAILSLMACDGFRSSFTWIADALGISPHEVELAMGRLERLGFVSKSRGRYKLVQRRTKTASGTSREAMLAFHHDMLRKALDSVYAQTAAERELSATLVAIPRSRLDEAREMIADFRKNFCDEFRKSIKRDEVYGLTLQFHRVSDVDKADAAVAAKQKGV